MRRSRSALASLATIALLVGVTAPTALAAGPERTVIDLNEIPQIDFDESAWASGGCGFPRSDRTYWLDGRLVAAITGRSVTGSGVIGLVIVDFNTGKVLFQAGNEVGNFYDGFCAAIH